MCLRALGKCWLVSPWDCVPRVFMMEGQERGRDGKPSCMLGNGSTSHWRGGHPDIFWTIYFWSSIRVENVQDLKTQKGLTSCPCSTRAYLVWLHSTLDFPSGHLIIHENEIIMSVLPSNMAYFKDQIGHCSAFVRKLHESVNYHYIYNNYAPASPWGTEKETPRDGATIISLRMRSNNHCVSWRGRYLIITVSLDVILILFGRNKQLKELINPQWLHFTWAVIWPLSKVSKGRKIELLEKSSSFKIELWG